MGKNRNTLLSDLQHAQEAHRASEKRGRRAVQRLRDLEKVLTPLKDKIEKWVSLPLTDDAIARCITTGEARALLRFLNDEANPKGSAEADAEVEEAIAA